MRPSGPLPYESRTLKWTRPPEVEGEAGRWQGVWQLTLSHPVRLPELVAAKAEVSAAIGIELDLTQIAVSKVRLTTVTTLHPLDIEAWPLIDSTLRDLHRLLDIVEINDNPRSWWRPFRR